MLGLATLNDIVVQFLAEIEDTELEESLALVGSDSTASMIGWKSGAIRCMEEILGRPLQWVICLLHLNELPLRQVLVT